MRTISSYWGGLALGAAAAYWFDPDAGARRRSVARGKLGHAARSAISLSDAAVRDGANRTQGLLAELLAALRTEPVDDEVLRERIRARLGHVLAHSGAVEVRCDDGRVELSGRILESELALALDVVRAIRGVHNVESTLETFKTAEGVPELQGGRVRPGHTSEKWPPSARLGAVVGGAGLVTLGRTAGVFGLPLSLAGLALLARGGLDLPLRRVTGVGAGRRAVDIETGVEINAPVDRVFNTWNTMESFPTFMSHVKEVRRVGGGRYHWTVTGPAGSSFGWDAVITAWEANERISWKSVAGTGVRQNGTATFKGTPAGGTRLDVKLSYNPPAGAVGHALAAALGVDPKRQMSEDLYRLKSLVEANEILAQEGEGRQGGGFRARNGVARA